MFVALVFPHVVVIFHNLIEINWLMLKTFLLPSACWWFPLLLPFCCFGAAIFQLVESLNPPPPPPRGLHLPFSCRPNSFPLTNCAIIYCEREDNGGGSHQFCNYLGVAISLTLRRLSLSIAHTEDELVAFWQRYAICGQVEDAKQIYARNSTCVMKTALNMNGIACGIIIRVHHLLSTTSTTR